MLEIRTERPIAEYRPMVELLKKRGFYVNPKKVQRLMKKLGLRVTHTGTNHASTTHTKGKFGTTTKTKPHRRFSTSIPHQKITYES